MGHYPLHLRKHRFKKGNIPHNKGLKLEDSKLPVHPVLKFVRLSKDEFNLVTKSADNSGSVQIPHSARFLRPKAPAKSEVERCAENENKIG